MEQIKQVMSGMDSVSEILSSASDEPTDPMRNYYKTMSDYYNSQEGHLNLDDGYDCPICKNKGYISKVEKDEFGFWHDIHYYCECQKTRSTLRRMKKSGLSNTISKCTFNSYERTEDWQKKIYDKAAKFTKFQLGDGIDNWFFVGGATGSGKTHICTAICRELLKNKEVRYMLWRDDVVKLKMHLTDFSEYGKMMSEYKQAEVLYIDDLFKTGKGKDSDTQRPTAADVNIAFELLNYRYNNPKLITIISSECTIVDLLDIDEAIGGRINEKAGYYATSIKPDKKKNYRTKNINEV